MFVEFQTTGSTANGFGLRAFAYMLDYVMTSTVASKTTAINQGLQFYVEWSDANPGGWTRRETSNDFVSGGTVPGHHWAWSQPVIGKQDLPFFHKGFALRWNGGAGNNGSNNYFGGYMGAFQNPADRTVFAPFDFARPLNHNYMFDFALGARFDALNSSLRRVDDDRYVMAAAQGYMFIGNITQGTFWAVVDGTTLPINQFSSSASIPMLGLSGMQQTPTASLARHDLRVHVHKYDSGSGPTYNQLSSFSQQINGDNTAAPNTQNFLNLYPSSAVNQGFLDRFDEDGKKSTALYPIIIGNPIRGNAYQTTEGILLLSGQNHETGQTFYVGNARYYKFVCSHDRVNRAPAFAGLVLGIPVR